MVIVATTTFYKQENVRLSLACDLIKKAKAAGYEVVVEDGSPAPFVRETFEQSGAIVHPQTVEGMGASRRELFRHVREMAAEGGIVLWTEPEKDDIVRSIPAIIAPIITGDADIVVPRRSPESLGTYPRFQVISETVANTVFREVSGLSDADSMFGPLAFPLDMLCYFKNASAVRFGLAQEYDNYIGHYGVLWAKAQGHRIGSVEVDFKYPALQKAEEEGDLKMVEKRLWQLQQLVSAYFAAAKFLGL